MSDPMRQYRLTLYYIAAVVTVILIMMLLGVA